MNERMSSSTLSFQMASIITSNALVVARQSKPKIGANFEMDEENNIFSGASRLFFAPKGTADFKEFPIVEGSLDIKDKEEECFKATLPPIKTSFKMQFDDILDVLERYLHSQALDRANEMLESIKEDIAKFYTTDTPKNRQERRKRAKELKKRIARFKAFCKGHNIELNFSR